MSTSATTDFWYRGRKGLSLRAIGSGSATVCPTLSRNSRHLKAQVGGLGIIVADPLFQRL
jgi:hypothetical protein